MKVILASYYVGTTLFESYLTDTEFNTLNLNGQVKQWRKLSHAEQMELSAYSI